MTKYRIAEMTWPEVKDAAEQGRIVLHPVAAIEQHGPHLPCDTDNLIVVGLCEAAAARHPEEFVVAPNIPYGFNDHNMEFPGTVSIQPETLLAFMDDAGKSYATMGFQTFMWVNGHGSNDTVAQLAARKLNIETPTRAAMTASYLLAAMVEREHKIRTSGPGGVCHACEFETSLVMHLQPDLVREELIADEYAQGHSRYDDQDWTGAAPVRFMDWWSQRSMTGVEGAPSHATAEKGRRLFDGCVDLLIDISRSIRDMPLPERRDMRPTGAWPEGLKSPIR